MSSVDIFPWNENFNTGFQRIDEQHKKLVQLINSLANHVVFKSDLPSIDIIFDELADYAVYHFQTEEALWHEYLPDDPLTIAHQKVHESFIETVQQLRTEESAKPIDQVQEETLAFLTHWLATHILKQDRYLAKVVQGVQSGMAPDAASKYASEQMGGSSKELTELILSNYQTLSSNTLHLMREFAERKSEMRFRVIADAAPVLIWMSGTDKLRNWFNQIWLDFTGRSMGQELGNGWSAGVHPDDLQKCMDLYVGHFDRREPFQMEYRLKRRDGEYRWIHDNGVPRFGTDGKFEGYIGSCIDLTDQISARDEARKAKELLENVLSAATEIGIIATDANGLITLFNRGAEHLLGYAAEELVGKHTPVMLHLPQEVEKRSQELSLQLGRPVVGFEPLVLKSKLQGQTSREWTYVRKDGTPIHVSLVVTTIKDQSGEVTGYLGIAEDITERKRAEEKVLASALYARSLIEASLDPLVTISAEGKIMDVNHATEKITGHLRDELIGSDFSNYFTKPESARAVYQKVFAEGFVTDYPLAIRHKSGMVTEVLYNATIYRDAGGQVQGVFADARDITERKRSEAETRIAATVFESQEGMLVTDANSTILRVNRAFTHITGYTADDVIGRNPSLLSSGRHDTSFYAEMWASILSAGSWEGEIWNRRKSGEVYPEHLAITAVKDSDGIVTNYVATLTDITLSKAAADEIRHLAFFDPLTRLPNRRLLLDRLHQAMASSARSGRYGGLLFLDLDHFKTLNDTLGHDTGDLLLQQVAARLTSCVREGDTAARLGGDEFVVMLEDLSEQPMEAAEQAEAIGNKILSVLNQTYRLGINECHSSPSIGATLFKGHQSGIEELLKQADIAMYQAKTSGRNTLRFFDPQMQDTINAHAALENELRVALEHRQFLLFFQVQVDHQNRPLGAEALIRWPHMKRGLITPDDFIPLAEETGLIFPIGEWVLEAACTQLRTWEQNPLTREFVLSVNVSPRQFRQPDFVAQVRATVQRHGIDPRYLMLELTEGMLLENVEDTITTMNALKELGIRFSLDDFGTGYSSLQYLKRLPLDQLKIDQSFVQDIVVNSSDQAIVRTIIAMAQSLNLSVIAEGVETQQQQQLLQTEGCMHFQGYLFGKPVPIEQFAESLAQK